MYGVKKKIIINIDKCSSIQFKRCILLKENIYVLNNLEIDNVNIIKDLGILFDKKLLLMTMLTPYT